MAVAFDGLEPPDLAALVEQAMRAYLQHSRRLPLWQQMAVAGALWLALDELMREERDWDHQENGGTEQ